jgi:hypothetical protein
VLILEEIYFRALLVDEIIFVACIRLLSMDRPRGGVVFVSDLPFP